MTTIGGLLILDTYFRQKKFMATGISASGVGTSMLVLPPLLNFLLEHYGYQVRAQI